MSLDFLILLHDLEDKACVIYLACTHFKTLYEDLIFTVILNTKVNTKLLNGTITEYKH